jgi:hypothetical protein
MNLPDTHEEMIEQVVLEQGLSAWEQKASSIVKKLAQAAYEDSGNRVGKKHKPYRLPVFADELIKCLNMHDRQEAEKRSKSLFALYHEGTYIDYGIVYLLSERSNDG